MFTNVVSFLYNLSTRLSNVAYQITYRPIEVIKRSMTETQMHCTHTNTHIDTVYKQENKTA